MLFFRAASRPRLVHPLFEFIEQGQVELCLSSEVLAEVSDVLTRPKLIAKYPALSDKAVEAFLAHCLRSAKWVDPVPERYMLTRDPKDSKYLNLAIEAAAPFVVSDDLDLLELMSPQSQVGVDFRARFPDIQIVPPARFARLIV